MKTVLDSLLSSRSAFGVSSHLIAVFTQRGKASTENPNKSENTGEGLSEN